MDRFSIEKFCHPAAEFYPGYFWVLNAPMTKESLLEMLRDMNAHGAKSICIHPSPKRWSANSEAEPDYLTPEYLKLMKAVHAEAEKLGMHSYYYDEGGFPSGTAVGEVVASDPARFSRKLVERDSKTGKYVIKSEYPGDYSYFYPPKGYPNLLEKGIGERFIKLSHEKLKTALGKFFRKTILYTFDDEAAVPGFFSGHVLGWCSDFGEEFFKRKGYRIESYFSEVARTPSRRDTPEALRHRVDYFDVRSQLFVERYWMPIREWSRANGLGSGGHLGGEHAPEGNLLYGYGHIMRSLRTMDLPGVDMIWRQIYPETLPKRKTVIVNPRRLDPVNTKAKDAPYTKYASSVARQAGHCNVLTEDFAAYGAGLTPQAMKCLIDHQLVRGANHFVFSNIPQGYHGKQLSAGCRPKFGKYHPFWDWFDMIHSYIARTASLLRMGRPEVNTLVYYDIRSIWCGSETMRKAVADHFAVSAELLRRQVDFDFADDDALAEARISGKTITVGKMTYHTLVIPSMQWMAPEAVKVVNRFRRAGGQILGVDELQKAQPTLKVTPNCPTLRVTKRKFGETAIYFINNEGPRQVCCTLTIPEHGEIQRFDGWSGRRYRVKRKGSAVPWTFPPYGSVALVVNPGQPADGEDNDFRPGRQTLVLDKGWTLRPVRMCRFDRDDYAIVPLKKRAVPVKLGDWRGVLGQWFSGEGLYRVEFESPSDAPALLCLGQVNYVSEAILNGQSLGRSFSDPAEFLTKGVLKKGRNILEIRVVNTPANSVLDPAVVKYWKDHYPPSVYQEMNYAFERESLESGLFGPVVLRFA